METLTSKVLKSFGWVLANILTKQAITFGRMVVLWRLLDPRDFGLNSMAWLAINGFTLLQDLGFQRELIQRKTNLDAAISVTWYANVFIRIVIYGLLFLAAPLVADHFHEPELTAILRIASTVIVLGSFGAANEAILRKNFQFKKVLSVDTIELVLQCIVQIGLAWLGFGVWSLIYGAIVSALARSATLWWIAPIRVGRFDWAVAKEMWHFGKHMTATTLIHWLNKNMDYYFVGRYLGTETLGLYTLAYRLSETISIYVGRLLGSVLYPAYSEIGADVDRMRGAWLRSVRYAMLLLMSMGIGMMVFAQELVLSFFEEKCAIVIVPLAILTVSSLCRSLGTIVGDLAKALRRPAILTAAAFWQAIVMAPCLYFVTAWLAMSPQAELNLVSGIISGTTFLAMAFCFQRTLPLISCSMSEALKALGPCAIASAAMALVGWGGKTLLYSFAPGAFPLVVFLVFGPLSVAAYGLAVWLFFPQIARELKGILKTRKVKRAKTGQREGQSV